MSERASVLTQPVAPPFIHDGRTPIGVPPILSSSREFVIPPDGSEWDPLYEKARVLFVDDEPGMADFIPPFLSSGQFCESNIRAFESSSEALKCVQDDLRELRRQNGTGDMRKPFELLILDFNLGSDQKNGVELACLIRDLCREQKLPIPMIIFFSSTENVREVARSSGLEPFEFLKKPFGLDQLVGATRAAVRSYHAAEFVPANQRL